MIEFILLIFGLFVGSFLGVVVDRLTNGGSIFFGRSHCDKCKKELGVKDLIPLFSFILFSGRCRYCKTKLSITYPLIELLTGIIFFLIYYFFKSEGLITLFYYYAILSGFIVIFFTDLKYGIIPDKVVVPLSVISIFYLLFINNTFLISNLLSGIGAFLFFIIISSVFFYLTKKESMGGGDIKLSLLLGLFLGFPNIVVSLYLAFLTGAIISIILILWKKKTSLKDSLPFGPFLIMAALISFFYGSLIYQFTLRVLGL